MTKITEYSFELVMETATRLMVASFHTETVDVATDVSWYATKARELVEASLVETNVLQKRTGLSQTTTGEKSTLD